MIYSSQALSKACVEVICSVQVVSFSGSFVLGVVGLFMFFVLIILSQAFIIICITRYLVCLGLIFYFIHSIMGYHTGNIFALSSMYGFSF